MNIANKLSRLAALGLVALCIGLGSACKKKAAAEAPAAATSATIAGAAEVMAAIEKKDYEVAMTQLLKVRQAAATSDQQVQYTVLATDVKQKLLEVAATDPKAAEALATLRALSLGR